MVDSGLEGSKYRVCAISADTLRCVEDKLRCEDELRGLDGCGIRVGGARRLVFSLSGYRSDPQSSEEQYLESFLKN